MVSSRAEYTSQIMAAEQQAQQARASQQTQQALRTGGLEGLRTRQENIQSIEQYQSQIEGAKQRLAQIAPSRDITTTEDLINEARRIAASPDAKISAEENQILAQGQIAREIAGEKGSILYGHPEAYKVYQQIKESSPEIRSATQAGTEARMLAKEYGFSSVKEFQQLQGFGGIKRISGVYKPKEDIIEVPSKVEVKTIPKEFGVVEPASALRARYWSEAFGAAKDRPIATGLRVAAEQIRSKVSETLFQSKYSPFYKDTAEAESIGALAELVSTGALYRSPLGAPVLIAKGVEGVIKEPTLGGKLLSLGEAGLGAFGLKTQASNMLVSRELKALETAPIVVKGIRVQGKGGGVDTFLAYQKAGKVEYITQIKQPYRLTSEGKIIMEGGQGVTFRYTPSKFGIGREKITLTKFDTGGRALTTEASPKIVKKTGGVTVTQEAKDLIGGAGRVFIRPTSNVDLKVQRFVTPSLRTVIKATGKVKPISGYKVENFIGAVKQEEGKYRFISGKPIKAKVPLYEDKVSFVSPLQVTGEIKEVSLRDLIKSRVDLIKSRVGEPEIKITRIKEGKTAQPINAPKAVVQQEQKAIIKNPAPIYATKSIELGLKATYPKIKPAITGKVIGLTELASPMTKQEFKVIESSKIKDINLQTTTTKQEEEERTKVGTSPKSITLQTTATKQITVPVAQTLQLTKLETKQITTPKTSILTRTETTPKPPIPKEFWTSETKSKLKLAISKVRRKAYEVQIKRKGKYITIAKSLPLGKAKALGTKRVTSTLAQTFRLMPKGETEIADIKFEVPSRIFTRPKKPTVQAEFVERRGMTLKRFTGEIGEILSAKKKARRLKWL